MEEYGLARLIESLSSLVRTGWMLRGVPPALGESVAEHSFSASLIALEAGFRLKSMGAPIDPYRAAAIALIHDIGEGVIGDIARVSGISRSEKARAEREAFSKIGVSRDILELFLEFGKGSTLEARVARFSEIVATLIKGEYYKSIGYGVDEIIENMRREAEKLAVELGLSRFLEEITRR